MGRWVLSIFTKCPLRQIVFENLDFKIKLDFVIVILFIYSVEKKNSVQ